MWMCSYDLRVTFFQRVLILSNWRSERMRERSHNQVIKMEICDGYVVGAILP